MQSKIFNEINEQVSNLLEASPLKDFEKNIKQIILAVFKKLDLVTRDEFEIQQKVLQQLRLKLEEIEKKISIIEANKSNS